MNTKKVDAHYQYNGDTRDVPAPCNVNMPYVFVSYSSEDCEAVWRDVLELQRRHFNIWIDDPNLDRTNASWVTEIETAIHSSLCSVILFYVSEHSLLSSFCLKELQESRAEEAKRQRRRNHTVPLLLVDVHPIDHIESFCDQLHQTLRGKGGIDRREKDLRAEVLNAMQQSFVTGNHVRIKAINAPDRRTANYYEQIAEALCRADPMVVMKTADVLTAGMTGGLDQGRTAGTDDAEEPLQEERPYQVFLDYKETDQRTGLPTNAARIAHSLYLKLVQAGYRTFCIDEARSQLGHNAEKEMDEALDQANVLVVIATSKESVTKGRVFEIWNGFMEEDDYQDRHERVIYTYIERFKLVDLPFRLRHQKCFLRSSMSEEELVVDIGNTLTAISARATVEIPEKKDDVLSGEDMAAPGIPSEIDIDGTEGKAKSNYVQSTGIVPESVQQQGKNNVADTMDGEKAPNDTEDLVQHSEPEMRRRALQKKGDQLCQLAENAVSDGRGIEASDNFKRAAEIFQELSLMDVYETNRCLFREGMALCSSGKYGDAMECFSKAYVGLQQLEKESEEELYRIEKYRVCREIGELWIQSFEMDGDDTIDSCMAEAARWYEQALSGFDQMVSGSAGLLCEMEKYRTLQAIGSMYYRKITCDLTNGDWSAAADEDLQDAAAMYEMAEKGFRVLAENSDNIVDRRNLYMSCYACGKFYYQLSSYSEKVSDAQKVAHWVGKAINWYYLGIEENRKLLEKTAVGQLPEDISGLADVYDIVAEIESKWGGNEEGNVDFWKSEAEKLRQSLFNEQRDKSGQSQEIKSAWKTA